MQGAAAEFPERPGTRIAWLWFILGGVFILIPGVVVLAYYQVWNLLWVSNGPQWGLLYAVVFGPPAILVAVGIFAIAIGARRYRAARS